MLEKHSSLTAASLPLVLGMLALLLLTPAAVSAQNRGYDQWKVESLRRHRPRVKQVLAGQPMAGFEDDFNSFFTNYVFAEMTQADAKKLEALGQKRRSFQRDYLWAGTNQAARDKLNELTYQCMGQFIMGKYYEGIQQDILAGTVKKGGNINGNYHPAVRFNATLILGAIDETPATRDSPPVPWPKGTKVLLVLFGTGQGKPFPDYIRVGALMGLLRHAGYGIQEEQKATVSQAMLAFVGQAEPPGVRPPDVHAWMRSRAAEVLAELKQPEANGEVFAALHKIVAENQAPLSLRAIAAECLGKLNYEGSEKLDTGILVVDLARLAVDICEYETEAATRLIKESKRSGQGGRGGYTTGGENMFFGRGVGGVGGGFGEEPEMDLLFPARRLAARLNAVNQALQATMARAAEDQGPLIESLQASLGGIKELLEDELNTDDQLVDGVTQQATELKGALANIQTPAEPASDTTDAAAAEALEEAVTADAAPAAEDQPAEEAAQ